jgi:phospholipase C
MLIHLSRRWPVFAMLCLMGSRSMPAQTASTPSTATPIKHVVVIFDENNSFDHYFGTYPNAANPSGEPAFQPLPNTPSVNGLTPALLTNNPNSIQPFRLDRSQEVLCDNDNHYTDEQNAYHAGLLDKFPESTNGAGCPLGSNMGYYDGNTVTALWNYAQHFAMSDNFFDTEFGTTVMGHLNLISGQTHQTSVQTIAGKIANGSVIANVEAGVDDCTGKTPVKMTSKNVGDLLTAAGITWGWFYDSFARIGTNADGTAICNPIYNNHYDPFMYFASTSNSHHLPPSSVDAIGANSDQANHQYDLRDFWNVALYGSLPAVSFLKFQSANTGHPADSTALNEQRYLVDTINALQRLPQWQNMAIMITYDDSDGFYDHVMPPIVSKSNGKRFAHGPVRALWNACAGRLPGPLRVWDAASVPCDIAVRQAELCRLNVDRHDIHTPLYRGQLGLGANRRPVLRCPCGLDPEHVQLPRPSRGSPVSGSKHWADRERSITTMSGSN